MQVASPELDQLEQRSLQQNALLAFGRRTNAQPPLPVLMQDAVALICEILSADRGGMGEVEGETLLMSLTTRDADGRTVDPQINRCPLSDATSLAAYSLRTGNLTYCGDLRMESRFRDPFLLRQNIAAALVIPLHVNGKPFGALGVYSETPREFTVDEIGFAETIAHLLSASIARIKAEQTLDEVREIKSSLLGMVDTMVMTLDMDGRVVDMNRACEEMTKFQLNDVRDQPFWKAMVAPSEAELVKIIFQSSRGSQIPSEFDGEIIARDGSRKRVSWSLKVLSTGRVQTILMTGRDRTLQTTIKAELQRMRSFADATSATLSSLSERLEYDHSAVVPTAIPGDKTTPGLAQFEEDVDELEMAFQNASFDGAGIQQRRSRRRAYRFRQAIAVMNGQDMPSPREFFDVDFCDISACGFSFFMDELPTFEVIVAALGRSPTLRHFTARVMRVARVTQDTTTRYLIGCDFIARIHPLKTRG